MIINANNHIIQVTERETDLGICVAIVIRRMKIPRENANPGNRERSRTASDFSPAS